MMEKWMLLLSIFASSGCKHLPAAISAHFAKEMCSCIFVEKRSEKACESYSQDLVQVKNYQIDQIEKKITAQMFFISSTAKWEGKRFGCRLHK